METLIQSSNLMLLSISAFIIFGYCYLIVKPKYGITKSISHSVEHVKPFWLFALTMMLFPVPFVIVAVTISDTYISKLLASISGLLICMVGIANCYQPEKIEIKLHTVGAVGGIIFGILFMLSLNAWYVIPVILYAGFVTYCMLTEEYQSNRIISIPEYMKLNKFQKFFYTCPKVPSHTWYIELFAIILIFTVVLIEVLK